MNKSMSLRRARSSSYAGVLGVAVGVLLASAGLPLVAGERVEAVGVGDAAGPVDLGEQGGSATSGADGSGGSMSSVGGDGVAEVGGGATNSSAPELPPGGNQGSTSGATEGNSASDQGVTPDSIRVGVVLSDLGAATRAGVTIDGFDPEDQRAAYEVFFADVNEAGIHGRKIVPVYETVDALNTDEMNAACIKFAQEHKVFAVFNIAGFYGDAVQCLTLQRRIIFLSVDAVAEELYQQANGTHVTLTMSTTRAVRNQVRLLHERGVLRGRTIGVVSYDHSQPNHIDGGMIPELERLGYKVAHRTKLSEDAATQQSQTPIEIQNMRRAGVDTVLLTVNLINMAAWSQQADKQGWTPQYLLSDVSQGTVNGFMERTPPSTDGALGVTATRSGEIEAGYPEGPAESDCRRTRTKVTGEEMPRTSPLYGATMVACSEVRIFAEALRRAGQNPTRDGWGRAVQTLGEFPLAEFGGGFFGPGRFDPPNQVRVIRWTTDCTCWVPVTPFQEAPY